MATLEAGIYGYSLALFTRYLERTLEEVQVKTNEVLAELKSRGVHVYNTQ